MANTSFDFGDLDFQLPDFSEFMQGIQTIQKINEELGDESAFRTNMEADLALLDFALEDASVAACKVETMRTESRPAPPPPSVPAVPRRVEEPKQKKEDAASMQKKEDEPKSMGRVVVAAGPPPNLTAKTVQEERSRSSSGTGDLPPPPAAVPAKLVAENRSRSSSTSMDLPPPPPALSAKFVEEARSRSTSTSDDLPPPPPPIGRAPTQASRVGVADAKCATCHLAFDSNLHKAGSQCSQCQSTVHCSSCLKTITLKSLGEDIPRLFCIKCIGVLRGRLASVQKAAPPPSGGRGRGARRDTMGGRGRGRNSQSEISQSVDPPQQASPNPPRSTSGEEESAVRLARLEAEHAAQAKEIEKLRLLAKLEADHAAQAREIERLKQQLNESDSSKHAPTVGSSGDKKASDLMSRLLSMPATEAEENEQTEIKPVAARLDSSSKDLLSNMLKERSASFSTEGSVAGGPPKLSASRVEGPGSYGTNASSPGSGPSSADLLAKVFQDRSRPSEEPPLPSPSMESAGRGRGRGDPTSRGRGRGRGE